MGSPVFVEPWKHYTFAALLHEAARVYLRTLPKTLPVAALILAVSVCVGATGALLTMREFASLPIPRVVAIGAELATFVLLALTPIGAGRGLRVLVEEASGRAVRYGGMQRYRLVGTAVYLAIPLGIVVFAFPLGVVGVLFYVLWMFAPHAVLVEADGGRTALRRSRTLFQGEFSSTALPGLIVFAAALATLAMAQMLVPRIPRGGFTFDEDRALYVRELAEEESYDPETRILTEADGNQAAVRGAEFDPDERTLSRPAPPPVPLQTALLWTGIPLLLTGFLDPIRWLTQALLYINLRTRREGLRLTALLGEIDDEGPQGAPS